MVNNYFTLIVIISNAMEIESDSCGQKYLFLSCSPKSAHFLFCLMFLYNASWCNINNTTVLKLETVPSCLLMEYIFFISVMYSKCFFFISTNFDLNVEGME